MSIQIRQAQGKDIDVLNSFQNKLGAHERPLDSTIKRKGRVIYYNIKKLINSKNSLVLIGEINGKPVGCAFGEIQRIKGDWSKYKYKGYIGMMFVEKIYRGKGVGRMIINKLLGWFKKNKIKDVRLQVYKNNVGSVAFYKKCGFKDYILELVYKFK